MDRIETRRIVLQAEQPMQNDLELLVEGDGAAPFLVAQLGPLEGGPCLGN